MMDIQRSAAYQNSFFQRAGSRLRREGLRTLVKEWFPVTQAFCQNITRYCAILVNEISLTHGDHRTRLETALLTPLAIATEEFGCGRHGLDGIHYRMFARLGEPLGISLENLRRNCPGQLPETRRLVEGIEGAMRDIWRGAGCIRVVEATAYNIVQAMDRIYRSLGGIESARIYTSHHLEYISLHLELEKEHDSMTEKFIQALCWEPTGEGRLSDGVGQMCRLFSDYWEAMARAVYEPATPSSASLDLQLT